MMMIWISGEDMKIEVNLVEGLEKRKPYTTSDWTVQTDLAGINSDEHPRAEAVYFDAPNIDSNWTKYNIVWYIIYTICNAYHLGPCKYTFEH